MVAGEGGMCLKGDESRAAVCTPGSPPSRFASSAEPAVARHPSCNNVVACPRSRGGKACGVLEPMQCGLHSPADQPP